MSTSILETILSQVEALKNTAATLRSSISTLRAAADYHKVTSPENTPPFGSDTQRVAQALSPLVDKYRECYPEDPLDGRQINEADLCAQAGTELVTTAEIISECTTEIAAYHRGRLSSVTRDAFGLLDSQRTSRTLPAETRANLEIDLRPTGKLIETRREGITAQRLRTVGERAEQEDAKAYISTLEAENQALRSGTAPAPTRTATLRTMPLATGTSAPAPRRARPRRRPRG